MPNIWDMTPERYAALGGKHKNFPYAIRSEWVGSNKGWKRQLTVVYAWGYSEWIVPGTYQE